MTHEAVPGLDVGIRSAAYGNISTKYGNVSTSLIVGAGA
ncbi:hypothetical protein L21SP2_2171 [Salinispira pacifica]|uniref:Uncharacterized protein n=1 Tax=Salinispira pacifica TaxID=1307761 RepID=V5WJ25_9SPIO|nr:hypothetical protein L21SP2_2171 [Salinispira pacifica]